MERRAGRPACGVPCAAAITRLLAVGAVGEVPQSVKENVPLQIEGLNPYEPRAAHPSNTDFNVFHETRVTKHESRFWGRSVHGKRARVATQKSAVRNVAPAAESRLPYPPFPDTNIAHKPVSAHRQPFSVALTTSAVRRCSRCSLDSFRCGERNMNPC